MKEHPILFSAPMVRAILEGRKTQTRRIVKTQPQPNGGAGLHPVRPYHAPNGEWLWVLASTGCGSGNTFSCPYGQPGDRLWVRETFYSDVEDGIMLYRADGDFDADMHHAGCKWQPSIFMPRAASRITLEVTGVRVEQLNDIGRGDAMDEGCPFPNMADGPDPRHWYAELWDQINAKRAPWASNPWVWVIEFQRVKERQ